MTGYDNGMTSYNVVLGKTLVRGHKLTSVRGHKLTSVRGHKLTNSQYLMLRPMPTKIAAGLAVWVVYFSMNVLKGLGNHISDV